MQKIDTPDKKSTLNTEPYEPPAIVLETTISTRAGSPVVEGDAPQPPGQENAIDLFPTD